MRHGKSFNHLSRKKGHRRALLMNMTNSLIQHKRINTTLAKAKALRRYAEPLITKGLKDTTHNRRVVFSYLQDKEAVSELFGPVAAEIGSRQGGYLRIIKTGFRQSDGAEMGMIEFVDYNKIYESNSGSGRKTRRGSSKSSSPKGDNLKKIEGIGPKVSSILNAAGILTFSDLATKSTSDIKDILSKEGSTFAAMDPSTWAEQASLASKGAWDELSSLQDSLNGGKQVEEE